MQVSRVLPQIELLGSHLAKATVVFANDGSGI